MAEFIFIDVSEDNCSFLRQIENLIEYHNLPEAHSRDVERQLDLIYDPKTDSLQIINPVISTRKMCLRQTANVEIAVFATVKLHPIGNKATNEYCVYICEKGDVRTTHSRMAYSVKEKVTIYSDAIIVRIYKEDEERKNKGTWDDDKCFIDIIYSGDEKEEIITYEYVTEPSWVRK